MKRLLSFLCLFISSLSLAETLEPLTKLSNAPGTQKAVLVLFSQPDCSYCDLVREEFLRPLHINPPEGLAIRELKVATASPIQAADGSFIHAADFALRLNVRFFPSVLLLSPDGEQQLTEPLIGISSRDFYGYYLDQAITQALNKVH